MDENPSGGREEVSLSTTSPGLYTVLHAERTVKVYPVQERELRTLGLFDNIFTAMCSIASAAVAFGAGIVWDMLTSQDETTAQTGWAVIAGLAVTLVSCAAVAWWARASRSSELQEILDESRVIER